MLPILLLIAAQQIEPPTTVNGEILGTAEQFATRGPGRVCIGSVSIDLVPGETVLLHVINGGLEIHEAIIGDAGVQDAWERAEAAVAGAPPGPTPVVSVAPDVAGLRIVVRSGERVDVTWTVPPRDPSGNPPPFIVGCHIPGHWERGMLIPGRWVGAS